MAAATSQKKKPSQKYLYTPICTKEPQNSIYCLNYWKNGKNMKDETVSY